MNEEEEKEFIKDITYNLCYDGYLDSRIKFDYVEKYISKKLEIYHKAKVNSITDEYYEEIATEILLANNRFTHQDAKIIKNKLLKQ